MPCLFNNNDHHLTDSLHRLDLTNPFNIIATLSPTSSSSVWSVNSLNMNFIDNNQNKSKENYFEPLPFLEPLKPTKQTNYPQLSQKHTTIKQSNTHIHIWFKEKTSFYFCSDCSKIESVFTF